jgi:hypothetical protein
LTSVTIPGSVTTVGAGAFAGNTIITITIGANVTIADGTAFGSYGAAFKQFYEVTKNKVAGTYTYAGAWGP